MEYPSILLDDLPDEILMMILKKLCNIEVLYSLLGVSQRFNIIVQDSIFTSSLILKMRVNDPLDQLTDPILDRFCREISPQISHKIKSSELESSSIARILLTTTSNYPNLRVLLLYNLHMKTAQSLFIDEEYLLGDQITSLLIDGIECDEEDLVSKEDFISLLFIRILTRFINLQYLNYGVSLTFRQLTFSGLLPVINSSTLLELHVYLGNFIDCLCLLDGRFNNLHTFYVRISHIYSGSRKMSNKEKLPNLRCFSLTTYNGMDLQEEYILPLLRRMFNLVELNLDLGIFVEPIFIDGNYLKTNIINHMRELKKLTFNIYSSLSLDADHPMDLRSSEDIQHTFRDFPNSHIISSVDCLQEIRCAQCRVYSHPYQSRSYDYITNRFPGGIFKSVRKISLIDEHPFEHEFFLQIAQSFPFITQISIRNSAPQKNKLSMKSNENKQDLTIAEYPHLTMLSISTAHDDYLEEFLLDKKTYSPNMVNLRLEYRLLERVTHNFTRVATQVKCANLKSLCLHNIQYSPRMKNYFPDAMTTKWIIKDYFHRL